MTCPQGSSGFPTRKAWFMTEADPDDMSETQPTDMPWSAKKPSAADAGPQE
jgi:hypothetical protein